jgi:hypothetical protein
MGTQELAQGLPDIQEGRQLVSFSILSHCGVRHFALREGAVTEDSILADDETRLFMVIDDQTGAQELALAVSDITAKRPHTAMEIRDPRADGNVVLLRESLQKIMEYGGVKIPDLGTHDADGVIEFTGTNWHPIDGTQLHNAL